MTNMDMALQTAQTEYQNMMYTTWTAQNAKLHTYLWLSVAILTAEAAFFIRLFEAGELAPNMGYIVQMALLLAIALALISLVYGIDSMRGKGAVARPIFEDYSYVTRRAAEATVPDFQRELIKALENCINGQLQAVESLGFAMRRLSRLNAASALLGVMALCVYYIPRIFAVC